MSCAVVCAGLAARLEQPDLEHLARVVPLVDRGVDVEAFVALEPDQPRAEARREHLGELGLADAGLALEEQRAAELEREEHGGRDRAVGDVVVAAKGVLDLFDVRETLRAAGREFGVLGRQRHGVRV